jgi:hypothetical protein
MARYELIGPNGPSMFQVLARNLEEAHAIAFDAIISKLNRQSDRNFTAPWRVEPGRRTAA